MGRRLVLWLVFASAVVGGCTGGADRPPTKLAVEVAGLPDGLRARVEVAGGERTRQLRSTGSWEVEPGTYTVTVHPVRAKGSTWYGVQDRQRIRVTPAKTSKATVRYGVQVPDTTKIITETKQPPVTKVASDQLTLTPGAYADGLEVGDIVLAPAGPRFPSGLCRKITAITKKPGAVVVTTSRVELPEAMPAAVLTFADAAPGRSTAAPGLDRDQGERIVDVEVPLPRGKGTMFLDVKDFDVDLGESVLYWAPVGTGLYLGGTITPTVHYDGAVGFAVPFKTDLQPLRLEFDVKQAEKWVLDKVCGKVLKVARLGPIPLGCGLRGVVKAEAKIEGQLGVAYESKGTVTASTTFQKPPNLPPIVKRGLITVDAERGALDWRHLASGTAKTSAGLEVSLGGSGPDRILTLNLALTASQGIDLGVDAQKLSVHANPYVGVDLQLDVDLDLQVGKVNLATIDLVPGLEQKFGPTWTDTIGKQALNNREWSYGSTEVRDALPTEREVNAVAAEVAADGGLRNPVGPFVDTKWYRKLPGLYLVGTPNWLIIGPHDPNPPPPPMNRDRTGSLVGVSYGHHRPLLPDTDISLTAIDRIAPEDPSADAQRIMGRIRNQLQAYNGSFTAPGDTGEDCGLADSPTISGTGTVKRTSYRPAKALEAADTWTGITLERTYDYDVDAYLKTHPVDRECVWGPKVREYWDVRISRNVIVIAKASNLLSSPERSLPDDPDLVERTTRVLERYLDTLTAWPTTE